MRFLQQQQDPGQAAGDVAEAMTNVHGSVWLLLIIVILFAATKLLTSTLRLVVMGGVVVAIFVLMNGPGITGSGVAERWNDMKAKTEAFWNAEDVVFDRTSE